MKVLAISGHCFCHPSVCGDEEANSVDPSLCGGLGEAGPSPPKGKGAGKGGQKMAIQANRPIHPRYRMTSKWAEKPNSGWAIQLGVLAAVADVDVVVAMAEEDVVVVVIRIRLPKLSKLPPRVPQLLELPRGTTSTGL